jgi:hypothetical protein
MKAAPPASRMRDLVGFMHRYISPPAKEAVAAYQVAAETFSLPLTVIALAWVYSRPFVTSTIVAATNCDQLKDNVLALNLPIVEEIKTVLDEVNRKYSFSSRGRFHVVDPNEEYEDPAKEAWGGRDNPVDPELDILINQMNQKLGLQ